MPDTMTLMNSLEVQLAQVRPLFQVRQAGSLSVANNTITTMTYDTVIYDSHSAWNNSTHVYTVAVAGWYWVSMTVQWASNNTGIRTCRLNQNGTGSSMIINTSTPATSNAFGHYITAPVKCAIGDTLKVEVVQTSGGALGTQVTSGYSSFLSLDWMHR